MALYEMPVRSPYQRPFRVFAGTAIALLLAILCLSMWTPAGFSDATRKVIGWVAGSIAVVAIVIGNRFATKERTWKLTKRGYQVELSDGKLIQRRTGFPIVEIPVDQ